MPVQLAGLDGKSFEPPVVALENHAMVDATAGTGRGDTDSRCSHTRLGPLWVNSTATQATAA